MTLTLHKSFSCKQILKHKTNHRYFLPLIFWFWTFHLQNILKLFLFIYFFFISFSLVVLIKFVLIKKCILGIALFLFCLFRILTVKKDPQVKLKRLRKVWLYIWAFGILNQLFIRDSETQIKFSKNEVVSNIFCDKSILCDRFIYYSPCNFRGGSRTAATSKMEHFVIIFKNFNR